VNPGFYQDLFNIAEFVQYNYTNMPEAFNKGFIGTIRGNIQVMYSNSIAKVNDSGAQSATQNRDVAYLYSKSAMAVAKHNDIDVDTDYDASIKFWNIHPTVKFGRVTTNTSHAYQIRDKA